MIRAEDDPSAEGQRGPSERRPDGEPGTAGPTRSQPGEDDPQGPDTGASIPAEGTIARARQLREQGDFVGAERVLREAGDSGNVAAMKHLGDLRKDRGDIDGALAAYRDGAQRGDALAMAAAGRILRERADLEGALAWYRSAATAGDVLAWVNVGDLLQELGDLDSASDAYQQGSDLGDQTAASRLAALRTLQAGERTSSTSDEPSAADGPGSDPARSLAGIQFASSIAADLPSGEDLLGFRPLVQALHALLNDDQTVLPLAIAITAPWGAGKSSVMLQLKTALEERAGRASKREWATVLFDAWKYERSERLWAALAKAIYEQPQTGMSAWAKLRFRARLEQKRLGWWRFLGLTLWPTLVAAAALLTATSVHLSQAGSTIKWVSLTAASVALATQYGSLISNPFRRAIERYATRPDYEAQLGFTAEADKDIGVLTKLLAPDDHHGLAVFVDDLDRCSSAHVVEVVEAMNQIFNSAHDHRCVFVLGLDRDVVATNISVAYADTVAQLRQDSNPLGESFGREFLAKLVQLSVTIPQPDAGALRTLMERITGNAQDLGPAVSETEIQRAQAEIRQTSGETLSSIGEAAASVASEPSRSAQVVAEAARRERSGRIEDSPEVAHAEFAALGYLPKNPRQVKRFHNAFRLQLYVANEDDRVPFEFTGDQLIALARWVAVRLRWPDFADAMARFPEALARLETHANHGSHNPAPLPPDAQKAFNQWVSNTDVLAVIEDEDPKRRLSALQLKTFLRIA